MHRKHELDQLCHCLVATLGLPLQQRPLPCHRSGISTKPVVAHPTHDPLQKQSSCFTVWWSQQLYHLTYESKPLWSIAFGPWNYPSLYPMDSYTPHMLQLLS